MSVHVCHTRRVPHLTRYKCLPPLTRIPRSLLGEITCLGMDRAYGRRFVALIFVLFRDSFKAILPFFWWSPPLGRATGLSDVCNPITPVGFRPAWRPTDAKCNSKGRSHFSVVRNPPKRVLEKCEYLANLYLNKCPEGRKDCPPRRGAVTIFV